MNPLSRRDFLKLGATVGAGAATSLAGCARAAQSIVAQASRPNLDILVLGGTGFIGPHLVRNAVARGHRVTIFTRGRHDAELPDAVVRLQGDRNGQLDSLKDKRWDVVVDDSATNPSWVVQSTELLEPAVGAYLFTSSTGVYYPYLERGIDESRPVRYEAQDPKDPSESFGVAKSQCERQVFKAFGDRGIVVRPTYIVGPGDTTDRFPYWPVRLSKGGEVLAPGHADDPMQVIDVRDLAEFMIHLLETGRRGVYNVAGPSELLTARRFYDTAAKAIDANVRYTYVDDYDFLAAHKIDEAIPWALLRGNDYGMMSVKNQKAIVAGLRFRPLADTVRDTLAWWPTVPEARRAKPRFTLSPETEAKALADWHALKG
jgi:2'-hydroxyisoflavone reductase